MAHSTHLLNILVKRKYILLVLNGIVGQTPLTDQCIFQDLEYARTDFDNAENFLGFEYDEQAWRDYLNNGLITLDNPPVQYVTRYQIALRERQIYEMNITSWNNYINDVQLTVNLLDYNNNLRQWQSVRLNEPDAQYNSDYIVWKNYINNTEIFQTVHHIRKMLRDM